MNWLEGYLPIFVDVSMDRLSKYMDTVRQKEISRKYSEREFQDLVLRRVQQRFPGQVAQIVLRIHADSIAGSGTVKLGGISFPVSMKLGIRLVQQKPFTEIREVKIGPLAVPQPLLKTLEKQVNATIERQKYPLRVKEYQLREGSVTISVEKAR